MRSIPYQKIMLLAIFVWIVPLSLGFNSRNCYEDLGCFPNDYPWVSALRPFPAPASPTVINVKIYLCTRKNPVYKQKVELHPYVYIPPEADFKRRRPFNAFIIHGFINNGNMTWIEKMKNGYLKKRDSNVFIVDWGDSALSINYFQAASDTRIVGAELARFIEYLRKTYGINLNRVHLIGHSLGAHIAAYCAKKFNGEIGRITGLDPAQPGFEDIDPIVRLDKNDAKFIDVIHTNARPLVLLGFGIILPVGHVDVYANGGLYQPGCPINRDNINLNLNKIEDFGKLNIFTISNIFSCSHIRAFEYFIEALESNCVMWARLASPKKQNIRVLNGIVIPIAPVKASSKECHVQNCVPVGLDTPQFPARGIFSLDTNPISPFCISEINITSRMLFFRRFIERFFKDIISNVK